MAIIGSTGRNKALIGSTGRNKALIGSTGRNKALIGSNCQIVQTIIFPYPLTPYYMGFIANTVDPDQPAHLYHLIRMNTVGFLIHQVISD
jgi:hypothetical protein